MKRIAKAVVLFMALFQIWHLPAVEFKVDAAGRHLLLKDKPFFWLGDTVWLLAQMPSRDDLEVYLAAREKQGFTVIQLTAVMSEERVMGTARPNSFGDEPFLNGDPGRPAVTPGKAPHNATEYDYWDHLDYVLERIHAHGFRAAVVTMFVGWGGDGYKYLKPENALAYGKFLGERYRSFPQIIWILGGDNTPDTREKKEVWNLVAKGITEGTCGKEDYSQTLMTYHINGGASSSQIWHESPWLDFNMAQTWSEYKDIPALLRRDHLKTPPKPCGLGEGAYEDGPQYPTKPINDLVIRKQAYWSYFAGGYHTYGNGNVWHFNSFAGESTQPWKEALHSAGARNLLTLRKYFETVNWSRFTPDQQPLAGFEGQGTTQNRAMRTPRNDAFIFYLTSTNEMTLSLGSSAGGASFTAQWVNPASGEPRPGGKLLGEHPKVTMPPGWQDALLYLTK
jgi:hypothetical protein